MADLSAKQCEAAALIASGSTITAAAEKLGIRRETIHEWMKINIFKAYVNTLKHEIADATITRIQCANSVALDAVLDIVVNSKNDAVRLAAARTILESTHILDRAQHLGSKNIIALDFADYENQQIDKHRLKVLSQNN